MDNAPSSCISFEPLDVKIQRNLKEDKTLLEKECHYRYRPLNEAKRQVRILRLAPGDFHQHIRGSLIVISLDRLRRRRWQELKEWVALSYVWGTAPRNEPIRINQRKIFITQTLHHALRYLRASNIEKYFWIDQICINQDDNVERASQVQLMQKIYNEATFVVAWLGPDAVEISALLTRIKHAGDTIEIYRSECATGERTQFAIWQAYREACGGDVVEEDLMSKLVHIPDVDPNLTLKELFGIFDDVHHILFDNAWFNRVWTVQEAAVAVNLILQAGWEHVTWDNIFQVFHGFPSLACESESTCNVEDIIFSITSLRLSIKKAPKDSSLPWSGVVPRLHRLAGDERDYVYGQLGLLNRRVLDFLKPDYSVDVKTVFMNGTVALIQADENLDTLGACCSSYKSERHALPSWCRDWSDSSFGCGIRHDGQTSNQIGLYNAGLTYDLQVLYQPRHSVLEVRGMVVDVTDTRTYSYANKPKLRALEIWSTILERFSPTGASCQDEERYQDLFRALINDTFDGRSRTNASSVSQAIAWLRDYENREILTESHPHVTINGSFSIDRMITQIEAVGNGYRSIFETKCCRFGKSCSHVLPGDMICILYGGRLPFIIREAGVVDIPHSNGDPYERQIYRLIGGDCYVHGLVDGEIANMAETEGFCVQDFCLI
ncbi:hypothetical protein JMJ35_007718 [Cladonia borealis]|uniref:Heterokaryon incompatibility domain-containing protein n=1 Tax=Cladonia borealis TaxID=184061 RepID=A0AA39QXW9_9LECA|nr:hypothetical protein JMJ35_007718 [Cladonia borealis]